MLTLARAELDRPAHGACRTRAQRARYGHFIGRARAAGANGLRPPPTLKRDRRFCLTLAKLPPHGEVPRGATREGDRGFLRGRARFRGWHGACSTRQEQGGSHALDYYRRASGALGGRLGHFVYVRRPASSALARGARHVRRAARFGPSSSLTRGSAALRAIRGAGCRSCPPHAQCASVALKLQPGGSVQSLSSRQVSSAV